MNIIFCVPGRTFSDKFFRSWTTTLGNFFQRGIAVDVVNKYSSNVYYARNLCLGGDNLHIMWIDSDIVWNPGQVMQLIAIAERHPNVDIVSGLYIMENETEYATVVNWDIEYFKKHGRFEFLTKKKLKDYKLDSLFEVAYTGFGFILVRRGVFEAIGYPWFKPIWEEIELPNKIVMKDFTSEDVGFCRTAIEKGFKLYVDPNTIVGHEKMRVLY